jgi:hypothetical protein
MHAYIAAARDTARSQHLAERERRHELFGQTILLVRPDALGGHAGRSTSGAAHR